MNSYVKGFIYSIAIFIAFVVIYHLLAIDGFVIDDGVFIVSRVFLGFIQWIYALPLYLYWKKREKSIDTSKGFLTASFIISLLNIGLILWIILDPSKFI